MKADSITVAALPLDIKWAQIDENLAKVDMRLHTMPQKADVVVLPELCSTGFIQDMSMIEDIARESESKTIAAAKRWSKELDMAIAGTCLAGRDGKYFNRGFFITPDGTATFYDKRHLFSLSPEAAVYSPGDAYPPVIRFRGFNFSMVICYDLRFPVWCRNKGERYDILLVPANWAQARGYAWRHLLIARAIENQAMVVGCNRSGSDDYGCYDYQAFIFDSKGYEMAPAPAVRSYSPTHPDSAKSENPIEKGFKPDDFIFATYTQAEIAKVRSYLPVGKDADDFNL